MQIKGKAVYIVIGIIMFTTMVLLGLSARVSFNMVMLRAIAATIVVEIIILGFGVFINNNVVTANRELEQGDTLTELWRVDHIAAPVTDNYRGTLLNMTVSDETNPLDQGEAAAGLDISPLPVQQINPDVERIIKNDPMRAAEIIRKMGLE